MKKKGFTLIELLAVIVVLAIIALIATPIVMNTIKNSKKGAAERTGDNYVDQVETSLMTYRLENGENLLDGEYKITSDGNLCKDRSASCSEENKIKIEMSGTKPSSGTIVIDNGGVNKEKTTMKVGDYDVKYDTTKKTFTATESTGSNVEVLCKAVTELSTQYVYNQGNIQTGVLASDGDPYAYGVEYTCELGDGENKTFYVLDVNGDNVSLIMNMNIDSEGKGTTSGNTVAWISKEDYIAAGGADLSNDGDNCEYGGVCVRNEYGPVTALEYLSSSTASWTKLNPSQISLPSGQQIATAGGDTAWTDSNYTGTVLSSWLYENLNGNDCPRAYWTSTASNSGTAWFATYYGELDFDNAAYEDSFGIRPVITISKTQLG